MKRRYRARHRNPGMDPITLALIAGVGGLGLYAVTHGGKLPTLAGLKLPSLPGIGGLTSAAAPVVAAATVAAATQNFGPGTGAGNGNYNATPPNSGAGWADVRSRCEQYAAAWAQVNPGQGRLTCDYINDATVVAIAAAGGWPAGQPHCLRTSGEGLFAWQDHPSQHVWLANDGCPA